MSNLIEQQLEQLKAQLAPHMPAYGVIESIIPDLVLYRSEVTTEITPVIYEPSLCIMLQGEKEVYLYESGVPMEPETIIDTVSYSPGQVIQSYGGLEPRFTLRYAFTDDFSIKASANRSIQYLHLLTNNFAAAPVDLWKLSDSYIQPQKAWQYALGLYKNLNQNTANGQTYSFMIFDAC